MPNDSIPNHQGQAEFQDIMQKVLLEQRVPPLLCPRIPFLCPHAFVHIMYAYGTVREIDSLCMRLGGVVQFLRFSLRQHTQWTILALQHK
jgi:hypothetical protein